MKSRHRAVIQSARIRACTGPRVARLLDVLMAGTAFIAQSDEIVRVRRSGVSSRRNSRPIATSRHGAATSPLYRFEGSERELQQRHRQQYLEVANAHVSSSKSQRHRNANLGAFARGGAYALSGAYQRNPRIFRAYS
jgi:hypothetical protein